MKTNNISKYLLPFVIGSFFAGLSGSCQIKKQNNINSCSLSKNVYSFKEIISSDKLKTIINKSEDDCNLRLVDSLIAFFQRNASDKAYVMLRSLSIFSDGYLSDYFVEELAKVYNNSFSSFFEYLYVDHKKQIKSELDKVLVECWSSIAASSSNSNNEIKKIQEKTKKEIGKSKIETNEKIAYLNSLLNKINPKYLD